MPKKKAPFTHVTAMRLAFEQAAREAPKDAATRPQVTKVLSRRRHKPGVVFHRKGWFVRRGASRGG